MKWKTHLLPALYVVLLSSVSFLISCQKGRNMNSFEKSLEKLEKIKDLTILKVDRSMVAVSGALQGRVLTSSANGLEGNSFGWINWELLESGSHEENIAYLGGESRLWFGPERGEFSVFFDHGKAHTDENMKLPEDMYSKKFEVTEQSDHNIRSKGEMKIRNASKYIFKVYVERNISILSKEDVEEKLDIEISNLTSFVGFSAETWIKNIAEEPMQKETGLLAVWELGCMLTTDDNIVILPLSQDTDSLTPYFTPIGDRLIINGQVAYYKADAQGINKIGVPPELTKNVMARYIPSQNLLSIIQFSFDNDSLYVNSIPDNNEPYSGDVTNIFNGEVNEGKGLNLPFFEFESSSSAKELEPGENIYHNHTTYHFEGPKDQLNDIAKTVLGINLQNIPAFR